ncbi:MAG: prolyl-tRNA synthetase associated domain-containing protein [Nanoarchaeota archaeon]
MDKTLFDFLEKNKIKFIEHKHPAVFTVEESLKVKNNIPGLHCKCLFLKDDKNKFYLIAMEAYKRADIKSLRKEFNVGKLHFASPEELKFHLNVSPGSVSIFAMIYAKDVNLIIDEVVWNADIAGFHPNINTSTLEIHKVDLRKFISSLKVNPHILKIE